jgi:hypothetical protein
MSAGPVAASMHIVSPPRAQLLVYRFGTGAGFEGRLVGALERIESGGTLIVLDALFVQIEPETQELVAIDLRGKGRGGFVAPALNFRLDPGVRRRQTQKALDSEAGETLRELAKSLEPGAAVAAVLVEHTWAHALDDAVARTGGTEVANEFVEEAELTPDLLQGVAALR